MAGRSARKCKTRALHTNAAVRNSSRRHVARVAVERGLDAAVRLGKLDEEEAREIWEDFRSEDEDYEEEAFEEGDFE